MLWSRCTGVTTENPFPKLVVVGRNGPVALLQGSDGEALNHLSHAKDMFIQLKRTQEEARTSLHLAEALARLGDRSRACTELKDARKWFVSMHAKRDAERAERLLREFSPPS
jgi:hypothetical protein